MILFEDFIVSDEIVEEKFTCDLSKCKGACCVLGDTGAPLTPEECSVLDDIFEEVRPYMTEEGIEAVKKTGKYDFFGNSEPVTTLVEGKQCAYAFFETDGTAKCAIEKAFNEGVVNFRKPQSCYLYPIRVSKNYNRTALNYHRWNICIDACRLGRKNNTPVFEFLRQPITEAFGQELFNVLRSYKKK